MTIGFIGAGKMAAALIARLRHSARIIAADKDTKRLRFIKAKYRIATTADNAVVFKAADIIILAVKPQHLTEVLNEAQPGKKLVISIAAGIPLNYLEKKMPQAAVVRAMPNNPCLVGAGMTALAKGKRVKPAQLKQALKIFQAVGQVMEVPEKWLNAVTGLSGSGPAFVYLVIEAMTEGGIAAGLPFTVAEKLALQTVFGAAETARQTVHSARELREMVTSPGGTTSEGLAVMAKCQTASSLAAAVLAATRKAQALSQRWAK